jgi:hypothetical protein
MPDERMGLTQLRAGDVTDEIWGVYMDVIGPEFMPILEKVGMTITGAAVDGVEHLVPEGRGPSVVMVSLALCALSSLKLNIKFGTINQDTLDLIERLSDERAGKVYEYLVSKVGGRQ